MLDGMGTFMERWQVAVNHDAAASNDINLLVPESESGNCWSSMPSSKYGVSLTPMCSLGTVEFRYHDGSVDPTEIESWVRHVRELALWATRPDSPVNPHEPKQQREWRFGLADMLLSCTSPQFCKASPR